jgi:predicted nuclease of predicted toxin-antitoxin system
MELWLDIHLSPAIGQWIEGTLGFRCVMMRDLGMQQTPDARVFEQARKPGVVIMTKDADFVRLLEANGPPPSVVWLTCGNTSNTRLREMLTRRLGRALQLIEQGDSLVEISDA